MNHEELMREAKGILKETQLLSLLSNFGDARLVGSVALDLVVKLDIDIHVFLGGSSSMHSAKTLLPMLLDLENIREVRITDYRHIESVKMTIDYYPGHSGYWSIDIWLTIDSSTTGFDQVESIKRTLTEEFRELILSIKTHYYKFGLLHDGLSNLIYDAVITRGVKTVEEFEKLHSEEVQKREESKEQKR